LIKPKALKKGDKIAVVSLSSGLGGESAFLHRFETAKQRLESDFGLQVIVMPNALKGIEYLDKYPEKRADDLMMAFSDPEIKGIFCMVGGDDTIRLLPYIDFDIIRNNPKIFMGYSDTTTNHFMMYKAGLVSFYGPAVMVEFAENVAMHEYTKKYIYSMLFEKNNKIEILPSKEWTSEMLEWSDVENKNIARIMTIDNKGYELLQGTGVAKGKLLGGCLDVFPMFIGTELWPKVDEWDNKLLFFETSEDFPKPTEVKYLLRNLMAQGIISRLNGVIFGKPMHEKYYDEYKEVLVSVIAGEAGRVDLPILYNVNFGHTSPICILPYGIEAMIDCDQKTLSICESTVI